MIGETVVIDQSKGNLSATGKALSVLVLDNKKTTGRADVIRYSDEDRKITFASAPKASSGNASLKSPESTLSAGGITVVLAPKENTLESMTALRNVQMSDATHRMTDGATLSYTAAKEEYEVKGDGTKRIVIEWKNGEQCRRSSGNLVIFYKGNDKVTVDGGQTSTAATAPSGSACTPAAR
jgi:lipopolysaccharide export system protein LptA